jgi:hypothetical protein
VEIRHWIYASSEMVYSEGLFVSQDSGNRRSSKGMHVPNIGLKNTVFF